jgi:hypothetical protein
MIVIRLIKVATNCRPVLVKMLIEHFRAGESFLAVNIRLSNLGDSEETDRDGTGEQLGIDDLSWLWRTTHNCAIQGCLDWEDAEDLISDLFDISREVRHVTFC